MNPASPSHPPRFSCRLVRSWSAITGGEPSRHLAACADCQAYWRASRALEEELRTSAPDESRLMSATLERRIIQEVRVGSAQAVTHSWAPSRGLAAVGAAAAVAALLVLAWPSREIARSVPASGDDAVFVMHTVQDLSAEFVETVLPTTGELVAHNPLQEEVGSIYADARSALGFLAMNFLPPQPPPGRPRSG